jgi:hypothetical protein
VENNWGDLANSVAAFAALETGIPGAPEAFKVILALCGIEDSQTLMLRRIKRDVQLLREGSFRSAQEFLRIAKRKGPAHADYADDLREAEKLLVQAFGQSASAEERSVVTFNLGLVEAVRGDLREAQSRLRESYGYCVTASQELIATANDLKIVPPVGGLGPIGGVQLMVKMKKAKDAANALESYLPFVNTVARIGNTIEHTAGQRGLRLRGTRVGRYELEWVAPLQY